jgi:hypothetical protein
LNWIELNWIELNWIELNWIELNWIELNWIENWIEPNRIELNRIEPNWIESNRIELNRIELNRTELNRTELNRTTNSSNSIHPSNQQTINPTNKQITIMTAKTKTISSLSSSSSTIMMMKASDQAELKALPGNDRCIDCGRISPEWASVTLAVFVCLDCSGQHRSLGTHISFVRSVKMDSWTPTQIESMRKGGGNDSCKAFLASTSKGKIDMSVLGYGSVSIREKYDSPYGQLWQQVVKARVEGREEPTELPEQVKTDKNDEANNNDKEKTYNSIQGGSGAVGGAMKVKMEGFGSSPHPSELRKARKKRGRRFLGVGAAAIGAIAAVGLAARSRRNGNKAGVTLSTRV